MFFKCIYISFEVMLILNLPPKQPISSRIDHFVELLAKDQHHICYVHPNILADVFPIGIEKLSTDTKKSELDAIQQETRHTLAQI